MGQKSRSNELLRVVAQINALIARKGVGNLAFKIRMRSARSFLRVYEFISPPYYRLHKKDLLYSKQIDLIGEEIEVKVYNGRLTASDTLQDFFVELMTSNLNLNSWLEIGAGHPTQNNNTVILESNGWFGLSIEIEKSLVDLWPEKRSGICIRSDALTLDYETLCEENKMPKDFGYLQIDIDPSYQSLACLLKIPFHSRRFAVITFEHDYYRSSAKVRNLSRKYLNAQGYVLVLGDVKVQTDYFDPESGLRCVSEFRSFEDWYVHPELIPYERYGQLKGRRVSPFRHLAAT